MGRLRGLGLETRIWTMPVEIQNAIPFERDSEHASYDPEYANRFWRILLQADRVFTLFRSQFLGKVSPVHFFWGSFDLAVTRFSGRPAPALKSVSPNVGAWVMQEAYSHEVSSCGFWPGNGGFGQAAFYSYAYPEPPGFASAPTKPERTYYDQDLGQFILPYDVVRQAQSPDDTLMDYLHARIAPPPIARSGTAPHWSERTTVKHNWKAKRAMSFAQWRRTHSTNLPASAPAGPAPLLARSSCCRPPPQLRQWPATEDHAARDETANS